MNEKALQKISYGLYIITSKYKEKSNGQIANALMQVSYDPEIIAVSINKKNLTHEIIKKSKVFTISILDNETPLKLIGNFGFKCGRDTDKIAGFNCIRKNTGIPIVTDHTIAYIEGKLIRTINIGTHSIFIGEVINSGVLSHNQPMTYDYYHKVKGGKSPENAPTFIKKESKTKKVKMEEKNMDKYECTVCGYVYDPEKGDIDNGIKPGTPFEELPEDWVCPLCGAGKESFEKQG
jgi:flavin reductase (DIM6/NTAB) family NADH-FMN oxidoreductase RutF/rubredoxin